MSDTEEIMSSNSSISSNDKNGVAPFDFMKFCTYMKKCISENVSDTSDVELESYLTAYQELYNFFVLLGGAFQFVAVDVKNKLKILNEYRNNEQQKSDTVTNFSTVKSMIKYEQDEKLLKNPKYVSGSRTLLRLHRGLDFIRKFLSEIYRLEDNVKLGGVAREVYDQTLAKYHTWVVRNTARVAMQFLPTRIELLNKISQNNEESFNSMIDIFPESLEIANVTYDRVQQIYSENDLLDLP